MMNRKFVFVTMAVGLGCVALGCSNGAVGSSEGSAETDEAFAASACPAGVPTTLAPAADQTIKKMLNGIGVQVYMCNGLAAGPAWTFVSPQANLLTDDGRLIGTHFIGPTWQGNDGSTVVGSKVAGATVDPASLPWLLLKAASHADDDGFFQDVTSIQRLATVGGNAPTTGCDADHLGSIVQVPYSAEYVFYKTKPKGKVVQCNGG